MNQTAFTVRMDSELKKQFSSLCENLGLPVSVAINLFAKTAVRENRIPFELSLQPNELTRKTIALAEEGKELNGSYKTMEDLRASLDAWSFIMVIVNVMFIQIFCLFIKLWILSCSFICTELERTRICLGETLFYTESVILNFLKWS